MPCVYEEAVAVPPLNCHTPPKHAAGHGMPHLLEESVFESIIVDVLRAPLGYQRFSASVVCISR
jgi:hypothetical protein